MHIGLVEVAYFSVYFLTGVCFAMAVIFPIFRRQDKRIIRLMIQQLRKADEETS